MHLKYKKSHWHTGKLTEAIYIETSKKNKEMRENDGCWLNVSGVLRYLGVSRSGYNGWKNRVPSKRKQRKNNIKHKICDIYDESHQNYGAPKITAILDKNGEIISEKTVGNYMREMGLKT